MLTDGLDGPGVVSNSDGGGEVDKRCDGLDGVGIEDDNVVGIGDVATEELSAVTVGFCSASGAADLTGVCGLGFGALFIPPGLTTR